MLLRPMDMERFEPVSICKHCKFYSVRMAKLSDQDRARALGLLEAGWSARAVAGHFGVSPTTICTLQERIWIRER